MSTSRDQKIALCCRVLWRRIEKSCSAELKGNRTCICSGLVRDWTPFRISHAISCSRSACLFCRLMRLDKERDSCRGCEGEGSQESQRLLKVQYWQSDTVEGEDRGEDPENVAGYREEYPSWSNSHICLVA